MLVKQAAPSTFFSSSFALLSPSRSKLQPTLPTRYFLMKKKIKFWSKLQSIAWKTLRHEVREVLVSSVQGAEFLFKRFTRVKMKLPSISVSYVRYWESSRVSTSRIHIFFSLCVCLCVCVSTFVTSFFSFPPLSISSPSRLIELHFGLPHCRGGQRSMKYGESEMVSARWWRQDCDGEREKARWWYGEIVMTRWLRR